MSAELPIDAGVVQRHYERARAARWGLPLASFTEALARSVRGRFGEHAPDRAELSRHLDSLHAEDLALAAACAEGAESAWDFFVREFRPVLYRTAEALRVPGDPRELADGIYAELFGTETRDGMRRSLFRYYHGRASLAGWLRTVLAQRAVDRARSARRLVPLQEEGDAAEVSARVAMASARDTAVEEAPDPHRPQLLAALRTALAAALAALDAKSRLRLALYYTKGLKLAQIGRLTGESEATVSRKVERARRDIRESVERELRGGGLSDAQVALCFEYAQADQQFDLTQALPVPDS